MALAMPAGAVGAHLLSLSVQPLEGCHGSAPPHLSVMAEREPYGQQTPSPLLCSAAGLVPIDIKKWFIVALWALIIPRTSCELFLDIQ